jgi:hypothetical protein
MKSRGANARATSAADARVLAALFAGVIAGALVAMLTQRPIPAAMGGTGECPVCPACSQSINNNNNNNVASIAGSTANGAAAAAVGGGIGGAGGMLPGQVWTPQTAPAAVGAEPGDPTLKAILEKVAINGEVLVAVSNSALINAEAGLYI